MASAWLIFPDDNNCLRYRTKNEDTCGVISVEPTEDQDSKDVVVTTGEVGAEICRRTVDIEYFTAIQNSLQVLESQPNGKTFCRTLEALMRGYGFLFSIKGAPSTSTPVTTKSGRVKIKLAIEAFQDQVEVMRNLHPDLQAVDETTPLDSSNPKWRHAAAKALGLTEEQYGKFGGKCREAIKVSTFSKRCYSEARTIMMELLATRQEVNACLFGTCCGYNDEPSLYDLLRRMAQGHFSKKEFKAKVAEEKMNIQGEENQGTATAWKKKALDFEKQNQQLKMQVIELQAQLSLAQRQGLKQKPETAASSQTDSAKTPDRDCVAFCSQDNRTEDFYEFVDSEISPPIPRKKQRRAVAYRISYKPESETSDELDDSNKDPEWKRQKNEKSSSDVESVESDLNQGFVESPTRSVSPQEAFCAATASRPEVESPEKTQSPGPAQQLSSDCPNIGHGRPYIKLPEQPKLRETQNPETPEVVQTRTRQARHQTGMTKVFRVGEEAQALFINRGKDKWEQWFPCIVLAVLVGGQMYRIRFNDGVCVTVKKNMIKEL